MFKPLKYQKGGTAASQEQLVQLFQAAAENAQVDPEQLVQKASEIGQDEEAAARFMQGLQLCAQGDPEGIQFIKSLFQSPAFKKGGKIFEFICKHAKGGYVSGCGCGGNVKKAQDGTQFKAPTNYYNEKGWQISENNALRRNNRTFYTEEPTAAGNIAWANNQMSNQLMWPGVVQDVQYNQPVGHYIDEYGNIHNFAIEGNDLVKYNNRKAQWKADGGKVEKAQGGNNIGYSKDNIHYYKRKKEDAESYDTEVIDTPDATVVLENYPSFSALGKRDSIFFVYPSNGEKNLISRKWKQSFVPSVTDAWSEDNRWKRIDVTGPSTFNQMRDWWNYYKSEASKKENGGKVEKAQFGISGLPVNPNVVRFVYDKVNNFLTPANKWEEEHGTPVIGGLGLPAYVSPVAQEIELAKIIGNRIPRQGKRVPYYGKVRRNPKAKFLDYDIDKIYGNYPLKVKTNNIASGVQMEAEHPGMLDYDINKLPMFESKFNNPDLNNIIKVNWPEFIGRNVLLPASGVVGSAAAGSYVATKNDKNKKSENK